MALKNEQVQIRMTEGEKEALLEIAERRDVPMAQVIREAIRETLSKEESGEKEIAVTE